MYHQKTAYFGIPLPKLYRGIRKGRRTKHYILILPEKFLDAEGFAGILLTGLSKPFSCLDCKLPLAKLNKLCFQHKYSFLLISGGLKVK